MKSVLEKTQLFQSFKPVEIEQIHRAFEEHTYQKGDVIIQQGTPHPRLSIIASGKVSVILKYMGDCECAVTTLTAQDFFGELGILLPAETSLISALADEDTRCLTLSSTHFDMLKLFSPELHHKLIKALFELTYQRILLNNQAMSHISITNNLPYYQSNDFFLKAKASHTSIQPVTYSDQIDKHILKDLAIFASFSPKECETLLDYATALKAPKAHVLYQQNAPINAIYFIAYGAIQSFLEPPDNIIKLSVLGPNHLFGCQALLNDHHSLATFIVREQAHLLKFTLKRLDDMQRSDPLLWFQCYELIVQHFAIFRRLTTQQLIYLRSEDAYLRRD